MSYIGNSPGVASQRVTTTLTATLGQTQFTTQSGYVLGYVDVFLNGAKLINGVDFEAISSTYITLFEPAIAGDTVELVSYVPRGLSDGYTKAEADAKFLDVGGDAATGALSLTAATLSGDLTLNGGTVGGVGYLNGSKVLTTGSALTFDGDGGLGIGGNTPRILANMSGTKSTRLGFQNSTTNGNTRFYLYPNGTGNITAINGTNNSDVSAVNYQEFDLAIVGTTDVRLSSTASGSAAFLPLTFYTNGSEQMRLTSTGLLVGLSSALVNGKLQVAGSIGLSGNTQIRQATNSDGNTMQLFATQVVVGSTNSTSYGYTGGGLLASLSSAASAITLDVGGTTAGHRLQLVNDGTGQSGNLNYSNAGTSRFFVNSLSGNVGIGTSLPENKLDVGITAATPSNSNALGITVGPTSGSTAVGEGVGVGFRIRNTAGGALGGNSFGAAIYGIQTNTAANTGGLAFYTRPDSATFLERIRIDAFGNVGIGTSLPAAKFAVSTGDNRKQFVIDTTSDPVVKIGLPDWYSVGALAFINGSGGERMRITAAGNVGIGTSSPTERLDLGTGIGGTGLKMQDQWATIITSGHVVGTQYQYGAGTNYGQLYASVNGFNIFATAAVPLIFGTSNTERARIDSSGNFLVGTTSSLPNPGLFVSPAGAMAIGNNAQSSGWGFINFLRSGTSIGSISQNGTAAVLYSTSSDYRLKNISGPITNSGAYIDSLNPVEGTWKADGSPFVGLIAHEVQEASRTAVATGTKDGTEMQGMDYSSAEIIANLIAEVKSLRVRVNQLEST
jgi:hypothetical protein